MPQSTGREPLSVLLGWLGIALLAIAAVFGGASRPDVAAPIVVRFASVIALTVLAARGAFRFGSWSRSEKALWLLLLGVPLLQLIPLPWSVWTALPARAYAIELFDLMGVKPWQPITLVHDRTVNAFAALFPALAAFAIGRQLDDRGIRRAWMTILAIALLSALLGMMQMLGGTDSPLRFYQITNEDSATGLFSNSNHHALYLAIAMPAVALWVDGNREANRPLPTTVKVGAAAALAVLFGTAVLTFSRAGVAFGIVSMLLSLWLMRPRVSSRLLSFRAVSIVGGGLAALTILAIVFQSALSSFAGIGQAEGRLDNFPLLLRMIRDSFPVGTGMGSLDPVFRGYETLERLKFGYLNNAHNDYLQLVIEAGVFAVVGLAIFFAKMAPRLSAAYRAQAGSSMVLPRLLGANAIVLCLIHSVVDYPLRTAAISVVFALSCGHLLSYTTRQVAGRREDTDTFGGLQK